MDGKEKIKEEKKMWALQKIALYIGIFDIFHRVFAFLKFATLQK